MNLTEGEFYSMQGAYISGSGADNFAVGAILHNTSKNRKDSPSAIDEKQLISLEMSTAYEIHNITVAGLYSGGNSSISGTFRLALGGKESRPIATDASGGAVAAAIRELLSNCEGDVGYEYDAGGNTFDCWQGTGVEYRGLASKTVSGQVCQDWYKTPIWNPSLALTVGLEKNLCRNPTNDRWLGVWCYNSNMMPEKCAVVQCGADQSTDIPLISTFEDEEDVGLSRTHSWDYFWGVIPTVNVGDAFCGRNSLYLSNSFSQPRMQWRRQPVGHSRPIEMLVYSTRDFPFICMAYKIPPSTQVSMQIGMALEGQTWTSSWRTLTMTNSLVSPWAPFLSNFDIEHDGQWHYTCLDVNSSLTATDSHIVVELRFFTEGISSSSYGKNPFWIDEFSISRSYRQVVKTEYPNLNGIVPRLISVSRAKLPNGFTWTVSLTSENCSSPEVRFDINTSGLVGALSFASDVVIQDHSPPLDGEIIVSFMGSYSTFKPYSSAADLKNQLLSMSTLPDVAVRRAGVCQTGFSWLITFTGVPGDLPLLQVSNSAVFGIGYNTSIRVETVSDGGLFLSPLPAEYFHVPTNSSNLNVWLDDGAFQCALDSLNNSRCPFQFLDSLTPSISNVSVQNTAGPTSVLQLPTYIIFGNGFMAVSGNSTCEVSIGNATCVVTNITNFQIRCRLLRPIQAGSYMVLVNVAGKGYARGNSTVKIPLQIASVTPSKISSSWPTILKISGFGFSDVNLSSNQILLTDKNISFICSPLNATAADLFCITDPASSVFSKASSSSRRGSISSLQLSIAIGPIQAQFTESLMLVDFQTPTISGIIPSYGSAGGYSSITILGSGFSNLLAENSVFIGGTPCSVQPSHNNSLICVTQPHLPGIFNITVFVENIGASAPSTLTTFAYILQIDNVKPNSVGITGGLRLTAAGHGFVTGQGSSANITAIVPGWTIYVIGLFTAPPITEIHDITLRAAYVNEVQMISVYGQWVNSFKLTLFGKVSAALPRNVNQYILQAELQSLLPFGSVRIYRQDSLSGQIDFRVEFRGNLGSVPLMNASGCGSGDYDGCFLGKGVNCTRLVNGMAPAGSFVLTITGANHATQVDVKASGADLQTSISAWGIKGGVIVEKYEVSVGMIWRVTFNTVQDMNHVITVDSSAVIGGIVTVARVRDGSVPPAGFWQVNYSGVSTAMLPMNASESLVQSALADALHTRSDVITVEVISADSFGGALENRFYPRQWVVRIQRTDTAGTGRERCTQPQYIDWDPTSCPSTAADLFLSFYPYYWPTQLPQPADLGDVSQQSYLQSACDREAISLNFVPSACQALRPLETLPYCGTGSGSAPPCWVTRFDKATVLFHTGESVTFALDDSKAPSDTSKGYLFWSRIDQLALLQSQTLLLSSHVTSGDAGMDLHYHSSIASVPITCNSTFISDESAIFEFPPILEYLRAYTDILAADVYYVPLIILRFDTSGLRQNVSVVSWNVIPTPGVQQAGQAGQYSASALSSVQIPLPSDSSRFTLDFWFRQSDSLPLSSCSLIVRALNGTSLNFGLSVCRVDARVAKLQMVYRTGSFTFSVLTGKELELGVWKHIAVSFDLQIIRFYQDGKLSNFSSISFSWDWSNTFLLFGSGCDHASPQTCSSISLPCSSSPFCGQMVGLGDTLQGFAKSRYVPFEGAIDWILWYSAELTAATIQGHSQYANSIQSVSIQAKHDKIISSCTGCLVLASDARTPRISNVSPNPASPGASLTLFGTFPQDSNTSISDAEVLVGASACQIQYLSSSQVVCNLSSDILAGHYSLQVHLAEVGKSNSWPFAVAPVIYSVRPNYRVSILGGSKFTIVGAGFSSGAVVSIGDTMCSILNLTQTSITCDMGLRRIPLSPDTLADVNVAISSSNSLSMCNNSATESQEEDQRTDLNASWGEVSQLWTGILGNNTLTNNNTFFTNKSQIGAAGSAFIETTANFRLNTSTPYSALECALHLSYVWTPIVVDVFPRVVQEGSELVVLGRRLPNLEGPPTVSIGQSRCIILRFNSTHIVCTVGPGEGGSHAVTVRYLRGYAADLSARGCQESWVTYVPTIASMIPSSGSVWGGSTVTVLGSGFSVDSGSIVVLLGSLFCPVIAANPNSVIFLLPPIDNLASVRTGLERVAANSTKCARKSSIFSNVSTIPTFQPVFPINFSSQFIPMVESGGQELAVWPSSATDSAFLVDGLRSTIWRSDPGNENVLITIDLKSIQNITAVILEWHSLYIAASVHVALVAAVNGSIVAEAKRGFCWPLSSAPNLARSCGNGSQPCLANQSSTLLGLGAFRAIDGNSNQTQSSGACMSTNLERAPWWRIDFGSSKKVLGGTIWNRDQYPERLDGFQVYIGNGSQGWADPANLLCYTDVITRQSIHEFMPWTHTFDCVGSGRYLYVTLPTMQYLSICEIEIYGESVACVAPTANLIDSFPFMVPARFAIIEISSPMSGSSDFRLRGLQILGDRSSESSGNMPAGKLEVRVNGQTADCLNSSACLYSFDSRPTLTSVKPRTGIEGDVINVSGTGFIGSKCWLHNVTVGVSQCRVIACSATWLQCSLTAHIAGTYEIQMTLQSVGRAWGMIAFTYGLSVSSLAPTSGGLGGGTQLQLRGTGFDHEKASIRDSVNICGVPCNQIYADTVGLSCLQPVLLEPPAPAADGQPRDAPGAVVAVDFNVTEDSLEFATPWCTTYSTSGAYCFCEAEDWMCFWERYGDVYGNVARTKAAVDDNWWRIGRFLNRTFVCDCNKPAGVAVSDASLLGFDLLSGGSMYAQWSPQIVYLRFSNLQVPRNATISDARLLIFAASSSCTAWSSIRVWAESGNSQPFKPSKYGDLFARARTNTYVDWVVEDGWKWAYGQEQSDDISKVIQEVTQGLNWRSGGALTLILRQSRASGGPCRFMSSESGPQYAPKLRLTFNDAGGKYTVPSNLQSSCSVDISVLPLISAPIVVPSLCRDTLSLVVADGFIIPSVKDIPLSPGLVPTRAACCLSNSHFAHLALDTLLDTYWMSPSTQSLNFTIDLGETGAVAQRIQILWTEQFASQYNILASSDNISWVSLASEANGNGGVDELVLNEVQGLSRSKRARFLQLWIIAPGGNGQAGYGIFEIFVFGCVQSQGSFNLSLANAFSVSAKQTPTVLTVAPSIGSTAGGTRVTLTGSFPSVNSTAVSVDFGGFSCSVESVSLAGSGHSNSLFTVICFSGKSGVANGGLKYVRVQVAGQGWSLVDPGQVFWCADLCWTRI